MESTVFKSNSTMFYKLEFQQSEHFGVLKPILDNVLNEEPDIIIVTDDNDIVATHKLLLSMFSRSLANIISKHGNLEHGISIPARSKTVKSLIKILTEGAVVARTKDELQEVAICGKILGMDLNKLELENKRLEINLNECTEQDLEAEQSFCKETLTTTEESSNVNFVPIVEIKEEMEDEKLLDCRVCGRIFMTTKELQSHIATGHGVEVDVQTLSQIESSKTQPENIYKCEKCQKSFLSLKRFTDHQLKGACDLPINCPQCNLTMKNLKTLKHHIKHIHDRPLLKCSECEEIFKTETGISKHMRRCHIQSMCEFCKKEFKNANTRRSHVSNCRVRRANAGLPPPPAKKSSYDKNYFKKCGLCHKTFHSRGGLAKHMRTHKKMNESLKNEINQSIQDDMNQSFKDEVNESLTELIISN